MRTASTQRPTRIALALCLALCLALLAPQVSSATFTRAFIRQITRTENPVTKPCTATEAVAPETSCIFAATGVRALATSEGDELWAGVSPTELTEFEPAYAPGENKAGPVAPIVLPVNPEGVAVESVLGGNGDTYVVGHAGSDDVEVYSPSGEHVESWSHGGDDLAIDNSTNPLDPSGCALGQCTVYLSDGAGPLEKFSSKGAPVPFTCKTTACGEYIEGDAITGAPGNSCAQHFLGSFPASAVTTDSEGDIYVAVEDCHAFFEYRPSGEYVREFSLYADRGVPPLGENSAAGPEALAYDPVSGHLLVGAGGYGPNGRADELGAVYEFDAESGRFVGEISEAVPGQALAYVSAVAADSHGDVYVAASYPETPAGSKETLLHGAIDVYEGGHYRPDVELAAASERKLASAVLNGIVDPAQFGNSKQSEHLEACYFQYIEEAKYTSELEHKEEAGFADAASASCEQPDAAEIPSEPEEFHAVHGEAAGLTPGVTYRYRLVATSGGAVGGTEETVVSRAFTAPAPPEVRPGSSVARNVSSAYADLHAQVKPDGAATSYFFEYGPTSAYGSEIPAPPGTAIGAGGPSGGAVESVLQHIGPLAPGSKYHFRVVAENTVEGKIQVVDGPDETFSTQPAEVAGERGYELVTPATKEGGADLFAEPKTNGEYSNSNNTGVVAESGDAFLFATKSAFGPFPGSSESRYIFRREAAAGRWSNASLSLPSLGTQALAYMPLFEPADFAQVALAENLGSELAGEGLRTVDLLGSPGGPYATLYDGPGSRSASNLVQTLPVGASRDLSHVVLESDGNEACGASETAAKVTHGNVLCESVGGGLRLLNLAPESESEPASACGAVLGYSINGVGTGDKRFAVSADGAKAFFTAPDPQTGEGNPKLEGKEGCWNPTQVKSEHRAPKNAPQLYMRAGGQTVEVSAPEEGVSLSAGQNYGAEYVGASEDGARVYFVSESELTADDAGIHDLELYEYDTETGKLARVSAGESGHEAAEVVTVYAVAAQGTAVYFTANGVLAGNEGPDGSHASPGTCRGGSCNLYSYVPATAKISFVARVNEDDVTHTGSGTGVTPGSNDLRAYATPDGRYLLFDTREDLTGYSTAGCIADSDQCMELYRYDARAAQEGRPAIVCVSCDPDGAPPVSNAFFDRSIASTYEPVRAMSNNGEYAFFDSADPLVPGASNGTLNAYEWHDGVISLIGSGSDASPTYFLGYAPYEYTNGEGEREVVEGGNVFIGTHAQLTSQATNGAGEIYDARVCKAQSPCIEPPHGETLQCEGSSCQTPALAPPEPAATLLEPPANVMSSPPATAIKAKGLTRAQKLQKALKACRREGKRRTRVACEKRAQDSYGAAAKRGKSSRSRRSGRKGGRR